MAKNLLPAPGIAKKSQKKGRKNAIQPKPEPETKEEEKNKLTSTAVKTENDQTQKDEENKSSASTAHGGSSRLIVKNLPSGKKTRWDEAKIRAHFAKFGTLTDVNLKFNPNTGACKFAFVGFANSESCQAAIKKMNGAYIQGSKLVVEECEPLSAEKAAVTKKIAVNKIMKKGKSSIADETIEGGVTEDADTLLEKQILDTGRLFLRNLAYSCNEEQLRELCSPFGPLADVECIVDRTGKCKGFALCTFMFPEHALAAWKALDGTIFMGRMLHVIAGLEKVKKADDQSTVEDQQQCRSAFQRERQQTRKENAAKTTHSWNALFLGTDAVAETMAENYEVQKRHLLLDEGENSAAVRMAMAEARLVRETRKFLLAHGVRLDAFSRPLEGTKRSKTVILMKNLNAKQQEGKEERVRKLFVRFGEVKRVLMPPEHGISALVEMATERDAKRAFEALAYSKKDNQQPLYLEWAPSDVFDEQHPSRAIEKYGYQIDKPSEKKHDDEEEDESSMTETTEKEQETKKKKEPELTKLLVRNVPFQANPNEIQQLFSAFGELKFIRMPKKPGAEGHRGFCFVDFVSVGDARRAMEALVHSTHLYGRRLVLEWAKQEESTEELRRKTKHKMAGKGVIGQKRPKMRSF